MSAIESGKNAKTSGTMQKKGNRNKRPCGERGCCAEERELIVSVRVVRQGLSSIC